MDKEKVEKIAVIKPKLEGDALKYIKCGDELSEICIKSEKMILKYVLAKLIVEKYLRYSYACRFCDKEPSKSNILFTSVTKSVFHKSMASNELIAYVVVFFNTNMNYHM